MEKPQTEKKINIIGGGLRAITLIWGIYSISRPIFEKSNFNYLNANHWLIYFFHTSLFVAIILVIAKLGFWIYDNIKNRGVIIKRCFAVGGGFLVAAFVIIWAKIVVPYFVLAIGV